MGRRQAQSDQVLGSKQVKALEKLLTEFCLQQGNMSVCGGYLPREGRGCSSWKMASSVLSRPTVFRLSQLGFYFFLSKKILAFDLSRWVGLCRVFSLVCGVSALPLQRQDVISVMSVQGFTVSYWLFFTGPMREPGSVSMNWQTHVLFSSPECIGLLFFWPSVLCIVRGWLFSPNIFWWPTHV